MYRRAALFASHASSAWPYRLESATVQATFYHKDKRRRDGDNLLAMLKPVWDGMVDAGVFVDDSGLTHLPVVKLVDKDNPRVEITVEAE